MAVVEKIRKITQLIVQGQLNSALSKIENLEKGTELEGNDLNTAKLLKSNTLIKLGNFKDSLKLVHLVLKASEIYNNKLQRAESFRLLGIIYWNKGEIDKALDYYRQSFVIFEKLRDMEGIGKNLNHFGSIFQMKGRLDLAIEYKQNAAQILEDVGDQLNYALALQNISEIYTSKGELGLAFEYAQKSLAIFEELGNKHSIAENLHAIGEIFKNKGDFDAALEFYKTSLVLYKEVGKPGALSLASMGEIYHAREEFELALENYSQSLGFFEEIGSLETRTLFYNLIKLSIDTNALEQAKHYIQRLQKLNEKEDNIVLNQIYRLAQAMLLKTSKRITNIAKAQKMFQQVAEEEIVFFELTVDAILNLSDLLLTELHSFGNEEVLDEVKVWSNKLLEIAQTQHSFSLRAETYLLQSKLALLELDVERAQSLLNQAKRLAEENDLQQLINKIIEEQFFLQKQLSKWERMSEQKLSIKERINLAQLEDLMDRMLHKRFYQKQEEIMDYAVEAQQLVEKWEREE